MKSRSLNRCLFRFAVLVLLSVLLASTVFADMGPHESVEITVEMPEGFRPFYATLLSKYPSTGPYSEGNWKHEYPDSKTYQTFDAYEDPDGYYFISYVEYCTDGSFSWGYMPPDDFKLLLYFPDTGELVCSEATTTFAFYSVYQATLKDGRLELKAVYNYGRQILSFLARLAVTLLRADHQFNYPGRAELGSFLSGQPNRRQRILLLPVLYHGGVRCLCHRGGLLLRKRAEVQRKARGAGPPGLLRLSCKRPLLWRRLAAELPLVLDFLMK